MASRRALHRISSIALLAALSLAIAAPAGFASAPPDTTAPATDETSGSDAGGFAVQPSAPDGTIGGRDSFVYELTSGQTFGDTVAIANLGTEPATFAIYATDARTTNDGSFGLLREEDAPTDVGTWIELGATQYTVDPGKQIAVPFSISVPADATPGDHVGAIVAQKITDPTQPDSGVGIGVRVRIGARVYVRVKGQVSPSLAIERFELRYDTPANPLGDADATIVYTLTNTGDIRLTPTAHLELGGMFGLGDVAIPDRDLPELLPGSSIAISELVPGVSPYLRLTADLGITAETDQGPVVASSSITRWTVPIGGVVVLVVLVLLAIAFVVLRRRRARA